MRHPFPDLFSLLSCFFFFSSQAVPPSQAPFLAQGFFFGHPRPDQKGSLSSLPRLSKSASTALAAPGRNETAFPSPLLRASHIPLSAASPSPARFAADERGLPIAETSSIFPFSWNAFPDIPPGKLDLLSPLTVRFPSSPFSPVALDLTVRAQISPPMKLPDFLFAQFRRREFQVRKAPCLHVILNPRMNTIVSARSDLLIGGNGVDPEPASHSQRPLV